VAVIIPALNEEKAIGLVLRDTPRTIVDEVVVVDNGSTDGTAYMAKSLGATVRWEPKRGYGAACLKGIESLRPEIEIVVFLDADYWGLAFGKDGNLYAALVDAGKVVQVDTVSGAVVRTVATGIFTASAVATDPLSGDLFVDQSGGGNNIYRVSPTSGTVTLYATVPNATGLVFAPDGTLYAVSISSQVVVKISGTNSPPPTPATWTVIASAPAIFGIAVSATPGTPFLYVTEGFSNITRVDLTSSPPTLTNIVTGGTFAVNLAVGSDGSLYATQSNSIIRITNADGTALPPPLGPLFPTNPNPPERLGVFVDIKPQSCPNPINVGANGTLPVAILGTSSFDVTSDHPEEIEALIRPIGENVADLVIGSRTLRKESREALNWQQHWGNRLATKLVEWRFAYRFTDLGPFRAIRRDALESLRMRDRGYGWTVEMQVKAACAGLRVQEIPVLYRRRIGSSKISGTVLGTLGAGAKILYTIAKYALRYKPCGARMISRPVTGSRRLSVHG
jgi:hypothetical protein